MRDEAVGQARQNSRDGGTFRIIMKERRTLILGQK
jgi:hypothetical protein